MSDSTSINALIGAQRNASVIDSLAHPAVINPLAGIQAGTEAAKADFSIRELMGKKAWNDALAASTDANGRIDYGAATARLAKSGQLGMGEAATQASPLMNDQTSRGHMLLGMMHGAVGALDETTPPAQLRTQLNATFDRLEAAGAPNVAQERALIPKNDADLAAFVQQLRRSGDQAVSQTGLLYGTIEAQDTPQGVVYVRKPPAGPAGAGTPLPFVTKGLSQEQLNRPIEGGAPDLREKLSDGSPNPNFQRKIPMTYRQQLEGLGYTIGPNNEVIPPGGTSPPASSTFPNNGRLMPKSPAPPPNAAPSTTTAPSPNPFNVVPGPGPATAPAPGPQGMAAPADSSAMVAGPGAPITGQPWTQPPPAVPGGAGAFLVRAAGGTPGGPTVAPTGVPRPNSFNVVPPANALAPPAALMDFGAPRAAPAGTPPPAAGPAQPPPGTQPSPGEVDLAAGRGPFAAEVSNSVNAQPQKALLATMRADSARFTGGPGADYDKWFAQFANTWLPTWAQTKLGVKSDDPAFRESFDKMAAQLATQQAVSSGAGSDYRMGINVEGIPHASQTPDGRDMILAQLQGNADYLQARATLANRWPSKSNYAGFQDSLGSLDPRVFQFQQMKTDVDPKTGTTQRGRWLNSLSEKDQREIMNHYHWAQAQKLIP